MRLARSVLLLTLLAVGAFAVVDALADATQTRPDHQAAGTRTEIVIEVETRRYRQDVTTAAEALWATCSATVSSHLVGPGLERLGDDTFRAVVAPGLGEHARKRVLGCLKDLTLDRVRGHVVAVGDSP